MKVPADAPIAWSYVDSYAIDSGKTIGCPSYVFDAGGGTVNVPAGTRTIQASHLQPLTPLKCGVAGLDDHMLGALHVHQFQPAQFLSTPVVSTVEVELKYFP